MLEVHTWEVNSNSGKPLIFLKEKGVDFDYHYVDVLKFEQHQPGYLQLNPDGTVPTVIHDGKVMTESTQALQYLDAVLPGPCFTPEDPPHLDERYPEPRLAPDDAAHLYDVQAWAAWLGGAMGGIGTDVRLLGWNLVMLNAIPKNELAEFRKRVAALPKQLPSGWSAVWSDAEASEDQLANARERIQKIIGRIEQALADTGWMVSNHYSITDITAFAYIHTLPELLPEMVNRETTPNIVKWLEAINSRPAVRYALALRKSTIAKDVYPAPGT